MTYYNTTAAAGLELKQYRAQALRQDQIVEAFFRARPSRSFSPSQVHAALGLDCPLTSVRRAITDLTAAGKLRKTDEQTMGPCGRPEHRWQWVTPDSDGRQMDLLAGGAR